MGKSVGETTRAGSACSDWHRLDSTIRYGADLPAGNTVALDGDEQTALATVAVADQSSC